MVQVCVIVIFLRKVTSGVCGSLWLINMSNWLGFSLTPHLRIDGSFGRENQQHGGNGFSVPHLSVMPLRSDGSVCVSDHPNRHSSEPEGINFP